MNWKDMMFQDTSGDRSVISSCPVVGDEIEVNGRFSNKEWSDIKSKFDGFRDSVVFLEDFNNNSVENLQILSGVKKGLGHLENQYGNRTNLFRESERILDDFRDSRVSLVTMFSVMENQFDNFQKKVQELGFTLVPSESKGQLLVETKEKSDVLEVAAPARNGNRKNLGL